MRNDDVFLQLYLIRHGESMGNVETDEPFDVMNPPLTLHGEKQAQALAKRMSGVRLDAIYSSPLERAVCTALPCVQKCGCALVFDEMLCEKDVCVDFKGFLSCSESDSDCADRADSFLQKLIAKHNGGAVAVVSHGEFIQFLIRAALNVNDIKFCVYNTSVTKINLRKDKPHKLAFQNDISHLLSFDGDKTEWM